MPLTFNIHHLENTDLQLAGDLPVEDLELELQDEMIRPAGPVHYDLTVTDLDGAVLVQGELELPLEMECVRCLKKFTRPLKIEGWACHLPLTGEDATPLTNDLVNLTPYLREDILLALPQHPLCEAGCGGLKPAANDTDPGDMSEKTSSAWAELDKLKL
jgi:uncharacterized metal-binding protein YceD (DUF177 family)